MTVRGIGEGETLQVEWPGVPAHGHQQLMPMLAALFPEETVALVMRAVNATLTAHPVPVAERPQRIAAFERELVDLGYQEEALVAAAIAAGEAVHRNYHADPAMVLGVRCRTSTAPCRVIQVRGTAISPAYLHSAPGGPSQQVDRDQQLDSPRPLLFSFHVGGAAGNPGVYCRLARAVPVGRWTASNSAEPADRAPFRSRRASVLNVINPRR